MAKAKKKLMIPFTYYHKEMIDYTRHYYEESAGNSTKIWWDTKNNKQAYPPIPPSYPGDTYSSGNWYYGVVCEERWRVSVEEYPILLDKYNEDLKEFNNNITTGRIIEVDDIIWKENFEFEDTLELTGMSRGRSAANFNLKSVTDGRNYNLFMTDTVDLIQNGIINKGKITGKWTFCKRGANYGIKLIP